MRVPQDDRLGAVLRVALPALTAFVLLSFLAVTRADADLWGHLTFGRDIIRTGTVQTADSYSFTSDQPWINHEWLSEALMWTAYGAGGAPGLVTLKLLLVCLVALALLARWRPLGLSPMQRDALLCATAVGTWLQFQPMRPQAFSVALFAWMLVVLERARTGSTRWLLAVPPIFAVWVNLHGGWIVGGVALGAIVGCAVFERVSVKRKGAFVVTGFAAALATLCNPYGIGMVSFLADTVGPNRSDIAEWRPLHTLGPYVIVLWLIPACVLAFVAIRRRREVPVSSLLACLILALGALRVVRLLGFFSISAAVLLVPYLGLPVARTARRRAWPETRRGRLAVSIATWLLPFCAALMLFGTRIAADAVWMPEPQAASAIAAQRLHGRMLTWFDYGEYAIWHFAPAIQVSMDGRRETVYSEGMRALHARIYGNEPGALDEVARLGPEHAWLPRACPLIGPLEARGWHRVFDGPRSIVLSRSATGPTIHAKGPIPPRWFPGP